jgi:hypothetical protein
MVLSNVSVVLALIALSNFRHLGKCGRGLSFAGLVFGVTSLTIEIIVLNNVVTGPMPFMAKGFESKHFYGGPSLPPELAKSVQTAGVYAGGHLIGLRVEKVSDQSRLACFYGLRAGDEIVTMDGGTAISEVDDLRAATALMIQSCENSGELTVIRNGKLIALDPVVPTSGPVMPTKSSNLRN